MYTYPENYKVKTLNEQKDILQDIFREIKPKSFFSALAVSTFDNPEKLPIESDGNFLIPHWTLIAKTYNEAVEKVLALIAKSHPFYNWRKGKLGAEYLRETERKKEMLARYKNKLFVIPAQTGKKYAGKSVETARKEFAENEVGLGAYEVGIIALTHPERFEKWDELDCDCPGDEYSYDASDPFGRSPRFYFHGDGLRFGAGMVLRAFDNFGSASGFVPQYAPRPSVSSSLSTPESLELRLKNLEEFKEKVENILKL